MFIGRSTRTARQRISWAAARDRPDKPAHPLRTSPRPPAPARRRPQPGGGRRHSPDTSPGLRVPPVQRGLVATVERTVSANRLIKRLSPAFASAPRVDASTQPSPHSPPPVHSSSPAYIDVCSRRDSARRRFEQTSGGSHAMPADASLQREAPAAPACVKYHPLDFRAARQSSATPAGHRASPVAQPDAWPLPAQDAG